MIRTGVAIIVLSALLYVLEMFLMGSTPPGAGANIGAGLWSLLNIVVFVVGLIVVGIGTVRWFARRKRSTSTPTR